MSFTPVVRYRNFTLSNLKSILEIYPDIANQITRTEASDLIEYNLGGYKKTAYQFACQLGLEDRSSEYFKIQNYLFAFDDRYLNGYLKFWFKIYFAPNPYVNSNDKPIIIFVELAKQIIKSPNYKIKYLDFFGQVIGGKSEDILKNAIIEYGNPIKHSVIDGVDYFYIDSKDLEELKNLVEGIETRFPIPSEINKKTFFDRFSYEEFCKFYGIDRKIVSKIQNKEDQAVYNKLIDRERNRLVYGAPGTGKSNLLETDRKKYFSNNYERVTFYSDYSYGQFVGMYKPVTDEKGNIKYEFVPGPFLRQLINSIKNKDENYLIIIEEINRANAASIFGDMFQLLDRGNDGEGEYFISLSEDIKKYMESKLGEEIKEINIPKNLYIWATMNSADQGVYPLDSAFKRRFDEYKLMDINENEDKDGLDLIDVEIKCNSIGSINWNKFRRKLNSFLIQLDIQEDKLIGPFFIKPNILRDHNKFQRAFKDKLLMYLVEDVLKHKKSKLFTSVSLSEIINKYNLEEDVFNEAYIRILDDGE